MGKEAPERESGGSDLRVTQLIRAGKGLLLPQAAFQASGVCVCVCVCAGSTLNAHARSWAAGLFLRFTSQVCGGSEALRRG